MLVASKDAEGNNMVKAVDIVGCSHTMDDVLPYLVEVKLIGTERDTFLKLRETLTRIGIASRTEDKVLFQTCHILQKRGKYYIVHFKTMFVLDGRHNNLVPGDIARQNRVIQLLQDWGLLQVVDPAMIEEPKASLSNIKIIQFHDKDNWILSPKYKIGLK